MFLEPLVVDSPDVGDCVGGSIVFIAGVCPAKFLVNINVGQDVDELLFCVRDVPD